MTTDDEWADALRAFSRNAYPAGAGPDALLVVRAGGRRKAARRAVGTTAACAVVAALAFGIPAGLSWNRGIEPIGVSPTATSNAPGPVFTNQHGQNTYAVGAGQAAVLDEPNLYAVNVPLTSGAQAEAQGVGGVDVTVTADGSDSVTVVLDASKNHGKTATARLSWPADAHASDFSMSHHYPIPTFVTSATGAFQYSYLVGIVPSWLHDPVVELVSDTAWTLPDGSTTHVAQVPTFRAPTPDGRLMYVVTAAGNTALNWIAAGHHVAIAFGNSNESEPFVPGCEQDIGAYGCDLIPMPAQYLTGEPAQFSAVADQATPSASSAAAGWPDAAPAPAEIAPGVLAATGVGAPHADGGFDLTGWAGASLEIVRDGTDSGSMIEIVARKGEATTQAVQNGLLDAGRSTVVNTGFDQPTDGIFVGGTVPADMKGVHVFLTASVGGFTLAGGGTTPLLEVPTFTVPPRANNPVQADRAWFLVDFTGEAALRAVAPVGTDARPWFAGRVIFASPDGTIEDLGCLRVSNPACTGATKTDGGSQAVYATIRQIVAKEVGPGK